MSIQACADLVQTGDRERFRATMAAPLEARDVLFPIHAFCLEVAKAPWMTQESMIAEMRLQFWRDVLEERVQGKPPRAHEVAAPLAAVLDAEAAAALDATVAARKWDIYRDPHEDAAAFRAYLDATYALPVLTAMDRLGAPRCGLAHAQALAHAGGLARYLMAVPKLEDAGRIPLIDGRADAIAHLADDALEGLAGTGGQLSRMTRVQRAPLIDAVMHLPVLRAVRRDPALVASGAFRQGGLREALRLAVVSQAPSWSFL